MPPFGDPLPRAETRESESRKALEEAAIELTELAKYLHEIVDRATDEDLKGLDDIYDGELWDTLRKTGGAISAIEAFADRRRRYEAEKKQSGSAGTK